MRAMYEYFNTEEEYTDQTRVRCSVIYFSVGVQLFNSPRCYTQYLRAANEFWVISTCLELVARD